MLRSLHMKDVGPAAQFDLELGERLNVLTGDNGLGKSFVLDVAWWALTGTWTERPVLPREGKEDQATIDAELDVADAREAKLQSSFSRIRQEWTHRAHHSASGTVPMRDGNSELAAWLLGRVPVIYVRVNGFSVWDPMRLHPVAPPQPFFNVLESEAVHFEERDLWYGLERAGKPICNGLVRDWKDWWLEARAGNEYPFSLLEHTLTKLSHPEEPMRPAEPRRLYRDDARDYPTVDLPYDNVPVAHLSAGMRRIVSFSYLLVWAWTEHERMSALNGAKPADHIVVLIDEVESHLHPKWQRHIMPRLLDVLSGLGAGVKPQVLATSHSPMVMASLEPHFDERRDKLFLFDLHERDVSLREIPWAKRGDAVSWLTSPIFGLEQARSPEAERAIEAAYDFMAGRVAELPEGLQTSDQIDRELRRLLPDQDKFWPRWVVSRERKSA